MPMNFDTLVGDRNVAGSIKNWANNSLVPSATVLEEAQALIYQQLRVREMRTSSVIALAAGDVEKALPTGFLDPIDLRDPYQGIIRLKKEEDIESFRSFQSGSTTLFNTGVPAYYSIYNEKLQFDVAANADMALRFMYFRTPDALAEGNLTNFLTVRYPLLLRQACMVGVFDFLNDATRQAAAASAVMSLIQQIPVMDDLSMRAIEVETSGG